MATLKTKELSKIGYTDNTSRSLLINIISKHFKYHSKAELIHILTEVLKNPENYLQDEIFSPVATLFSQKEEACSSHFLLKYGLNLPFHVPWYDR